jgi:glycosyltransferase involved in cell wall biosynthesis
MRIAWFSPLPPSRSGIAAYSADVLACLTTHQVEAFVDDGPGRESVGGVAAIPGVSIRGAHEFVWRRARRPYDLVVYHVGNDSAHDYMWPYLVRYPGFVVLHDAQLHQARARALIRRHLEDDYRAEFAYCYPDAPPAIADLIVAGLGGTLCYLWPMVRIPVEAARLVAVHNTYLARDLECRFPGRGIARIHLGVPDPLAAPAVPGLDVRRRHGIPEAAVVFGSFGRVTPEKGLTAVLQALSQVAPSVPDLRLLIVGETAPYFDVMAQARELGVAASVIEAGYVNNEELPAYLSAVDVCLNLRWPTGRETSAAWMRCLAAAKPTIVTDLVHETDVPALDLRSMRVASTGPAGAEPVCVHVELIDEIHMLRLALQRLTGDRELRARIGLAARRYWAEHATVALMARDYEAVMARAAATPTPATPANWPRHLTADGSATARALAREIGVPYPLGPQSGDAGHADRERLNEGT